MKITKEVPLPVAPPPTTYHIEITEEEAKLLIHSLVCWRSQFYCTQNKTQEVHQFAHTLEDQLSKLGAKG